MTEKKLDEILFVVKGIKEELEWIKSHLSIKEPVIKEVQKELVEETTTVAETITGTVQIVTEKAIKIIVGTKYAWIPKKCIKNLDKIALEQDHIAEIIPLDWFKEKIEWKAIQ